MVLIEAHRIDAGAVPKDDLGGDFLSSSGLVTSSEEYYPTVAINALMRALRDPAMSSHHSHVVRSLFEIFQALQLAAVPFLPKASMPSLCGCLMDIFCMWWWINHSLFGTDWSCCSCGALTSRVARCQAPYHSAMNTSGMHVCQQHHECPGREVGS